MLQRRSLVFASLVFGVGFFLSIVGARPAAAQVATAEYRFPPDINDRFVAPYTTEVWARVWRPTFSGTTRYPLIMMLHGNHHSCGKNGTSPRVDDNDQYADLGTCPSGYSVVHSHEGFDYLANDLASRGYIVVSINAHLGFPESSSTPDDDPARLRARGRLLLWHLKRISDWNSGAEATPSTLGVSFRNRVDFSQVGLLGHSRGAPSVRSAAADYRDSPPGGWAASIPNMIIRGVVEIAPPDVPPQTLPIEDVINTPSLTVVGMCDADVVPMGASKQLDRLLGFGSESGAAFKAVYGIYGANHNYFNTQWQLNDASSGCLNQTPLFTGAANETGSSSQRSAAITAVRNFFQATVGANRNASLAHIFDPVFAAPSGPTIVRSFTASPMYANTTRLEDFSAPTGINSNWQSNLTNGLSVYEHRAGVLEHDDNYFIGRIQWTAASSSTYFQSNWSASNVGWDLRADKYLEFRVDQSHWSPFTGSVDFSVALVNANGTLSSSVASSSYVSLPVLPATNDQPGFGFYPHPLMKTVRIPLSAFGNVNLAAVQGVRFTFNRASKGEIFLGSIRATTM